MSPARVAPASHPTMLKEDTQARGSYLCTANLKRFSTDLWFGMAHGRKSMKGARANLLRVAGGEVEASGGAEVDHGVLAELIEQRLLNPGVQYSCIMCRGASPSTTALTPIVRHHACSCLLGACRLSVLCVLFPGADEVLCLTIRC